VNLRLSPEPPEEERAAILRVLGRPRPHPAYASRWRKAGLVYATARPRKRRGATRA
jgi:hypothetical protein